MVEIRPRSGGAAYNPQRDFVYCYVPAMREAIRGLDKAYWPPWLAALLKSSDVDDEVMASGVQALTEAHRLFLSREATTPAIALEMSGFLDMPDAVMLAIFARLGEVMLGGFWQAIRAVSRPDRPPPAECQLEELVAAGRLIMERVHGKTETPPAQTLQEDLEGMRLRNDDLSAAFAGVEGKCQYLEKKHMAERVQRHRLSLWGHLREWCSSRWGHTITA